MDQGRTGEALSQNGYGGVRRTKRRQSQKMNFQEFWDSCAQNKTSEISTKCTFRNSGTPVRRTRRRKPQTNALPGILGLLFAGQNVGNLKTRTFRNSGTPFRRTKRKTFQDAHFLNFGGSGSQNKNLRNRKHALSDFVGLWAAEHDVEQINK